MVRTAEIGIIGVGTAGSMALWQLARRGVEVVGFEQFYPGHALGAAGGDTRLCRIASEGHEFIPMSRRARPLWRELEAESGLSLYDACGGLSIGQPDSAPICKVTGNAEAFGLPHEKLDAAELRRRYPHLPVQDGEIGFLDSEAGQVKAQVSIVAATDVAERAGAKILRGCAVSDIRADEDGVRFRAAGEDWRVRRLILSPGAWANAFGAAMLPAVTIKRVAVYWYPLRNAGLYRPDVFPILERQNGEGFFYAWPCIDGSTLKVALGQGIGLETIASPDGFDQSLMDGLRPRMDAVVAEYLPDVIPVQIRHAVAIDGYTGDGSFIFGPLAGAPNILAMTGLSGHGFKMAPEIGRQAAEWATRGEPSADMLKMRA